MATMKTTKKTRLYEYFPKSLTMKVDMIDWLDEEAERRNCSVSEFARKVFDCYRENTAEIDRICPALSCPERAA